MHIFTATVLALLAATVSAKDGRTFAVNHFYGDGPLLLSRMDPIVSPGVASSHHHTIQGGSNFALTMSDTTLLSSSCTTSRIKNDRSNYWTPSLFFQDPKDGTFTPVPMFYMNVYYFFEGTNDVIKAFPTGLRMVVGDPKLRSPPYTSGLNLHPEKGPIQPIQWTCPRAKGASGPTYPPNSDGMHGSGIVDPQGADRGVGFPDVNCDGYAAPLRADIHFPSCYNPAVSVDDYKNNMAYPSTTGVNKEDCPAGWVHTPHLFYEVYWNTLLFKDRWTPGQGKQPFVLSNGDPTGYSLHGDFLNGWDSNTLQTIINTCDAGDPGMEKCPNIPGGLSDDTKSCHAPQAIPDNFVVNEQLTTKLTALPGNNPVTGFGSTPASGPVSPVQPGTGSSSVSGPVAPTSKGAPKPSPSTSAGAGQPSPVTSVEHAANPTTKPSTPTTTKAAGTTSTVSDSPAPVNTRASEAGNNTTNSAAASIAGWSSYGCYADKLGADRVLAGLKFANVDGEVSNTNCVAHCDQKGFSMAGTEYGGQCFCGNSLKESVQLASDKCDMKCEGATTEICGGHLSLTVYKKGNAKMLRHLNVHAMARRNMHMPQPLSV